MDHDTGWPPKAWRDAIIELGTTGVLSKTNKAIKDLWSTFNLAGPVKKLIESLLSTDDALYAKRALEELRNACRSKADVEATMVQAKKLGLTEVPGWFGPSRLGTTTYNDLLEAINAKRLWQAGRHDLYPWPFNGSAKKPDYVAGIKPVKPGQTDDTYYASVDYVGDNIKCSGHKSLDTLATAVKDAVVSKLLAYPGKRLWVVVDLCDNEALLGDYSIQDVIARVDTALNDVENDKYLEKVSIVLPTHVHTFDFED